MPPQNRIFPAKAQELRKKTLLTPKIAGGIIKWQVLCEYNGSDEFQQWYAYGNYIDEVLAMGTGIFASTARFYIHDHLYSPVALTDYSGTVLERYEYDAYGNPTIWNADFTTERDKSNYGNPYLFTGRRTDYLDSGSLKIQYNRNRYYDYYTGRWLTHDPLGITPNAQWTNKWEVVEQYVKGLGLYEYVNSRPNIGLDPEGLVGAMPDPWPPEPPPDFFPPSPPDILDLTSVCEKYSCKQCCKVGVNYDNEERSLCYIEALMLTMRYHWGLINYWATGPAYTSCWEYALYIKQTMKPASGLRYFSLKIGGKKTIHVFGIEGWHFYVGVFHLCNPQMHPLIFGTGNFSSDATLDPWSVGLFPFPYNRGFGNPNVQPGRDTDFNWN